jgi:hypothetical protein
MSLLSAFLVFLTLILSIGCSTIHYASQGEIPVYLSGTEGHSENFNAKGKVEFYFWGQYPNNQVVYLDTIGKDQGFTEISSITIEEGLSFKDWMQTVFSLGMYNPRSYKVKGIGKRL